MIFQKEVKSVLNKHKKRDSWFLDDYSVNPYEGCGFNCIYCYTRGSKYGENLGENHYPSWYFQNQLRKKAERLCKKYNIRNSIL